MKISTRFRIQNIGKCIRFNFKNPPDYLIKTVKYVNGLNRYYSKALSNN